MTLDNDKLKFALAAAIFSGAWAAGLTIAFFGIIPTIAIVYASGFLSCALGITTAYALNRMLNAKS